MIYLDNAATSWPKPRCTIGAMAAALEESGANPGRAGHSLSLAAGRIVEGCREAIAQMLGERDASRVVFALNATDALNMAIHGTLRTGDHAVATLLEHNSVLRPLSELSRAGVIALTIVPPDAQGRICAQDIERAMTPRTRLVVMTHMSNVLGAAQDVAAVGRVCRRRGAMLLVDCAQTAGHLPLTPGAWGASMAAMAGHKGLLGPHGTGALWIAPGISVAPLRQGGTGSSSESMLQPRVMPDCLESGTLNLPGIAGLHAGMRYALSVMRETHERTVLLCDLLRAELLNLPDVRVYTPAGASLVSFNIGGVSSQAAADALDREGIAVRGGLHCAPGTHRFLGTLTTGAVRVSPGCMNTREDVMALVKCAAKLASFQ
ncbi:MAG: aminotransferase class V-fold PLP-dependent enzyme [Eubacteriales bacterium]|nr:aminotransferase class V-fold PLP-dependent enzyme [Eubacteriales bacterium]